MNSRGIQDDLWCDVQHSRLWAATEEVHKLKMIFDVMCNIPDCEQQLRSPQVQDDLWCDAKHSRLWAAAEEVHKFMLISDVMCNTEDYEQQLKKSTYSGWSRMWCATQQTASNSWRIPQIQVDLWCDVQHSRLWTATEVQKFRVISDLVCNKDSWEAVKCWHLLILSSLPSHTWTERVAGSSEINYSSESA